MTKARILFAALVFAAFAAPVCAQTQGAQTPMRASESDSGSAPIRSSDDTNWSPPDYSVSHMPTQLQPQPHYYAPPPSPVPASEVEPNPTDTGAQPTAAQQSAPPASTTNAPQQWSPPAVTQTVQPPQQQQQAAQRQSVPQQPARETVVVQARANPSPVYILGTGDKVHVTVFGEDDLSGDFQVDGSGFISMPLIGQVKAAGFSTDQLAGTLTSELQDGYLVEPRVSVSVSTYRPFYIIGQVNKPGEYPYVNNMSALNAIALAGGYTDSANESTIYVRANGDTVEHAVAADATTRIEPGDVVRVPESPFWSVMRVFSPMAGALAPFAYASHL
jgi:polysaccharide export outer membrane protein